MNEVTQRPKDDIDEIVQAALTQRPKDDIDAIVEAALCPVASELAYAFRKSPGSFNTPHEGYAVILEKLEELWQLVRRSGQFRHAGHAWSLTREQLDQMRSEAIQVAAMAVRFCVDLCPRTD